MAKHYINLADITLAEGVLAASVKLFKPKAANAEKIAQAVENQLEALSQNEAITVDMLCKQIYEAAQKIKVGLTSSRKPAAS